MVRQSVKYCVNCTTRTDPLEFQCEACLKPLCSSCNVIAANFQTVCPTCFDFAPQEDLFEEFEEGGELALMH